MGGGGKGSVPEPQPVETKPPAPPVRKTDELDKPKASVDTQSKGEAENKNKAAKSVYASTQTLGQTAQEAETVYQKTLGGS